MNRTLKYALSVVLGTVLFGAVYGDGEVLPTPAGEGAGSPGMGAESASFPDTPQNHWAYEAVTKLKEHGILQGYPDGLYRGGRTATRYEMAVAIHAAWSKLKAMYDSLDGQIKALTDKLNSLEGLAADVKALRDQLAALQKDVGAMKPWGEDIANLKKLAEEFKAELAKLGADVDAMKKDLTSLEERIRKLEQRRHTVEISGDANVLALAGHGSCSEVDCCHPCFGSNVSYNTYGITENGRITGVGRGAYAPDRWGNPVGPLRDLTVLHEAAFQFKTTNERGPKLQATLVAGNMLSSDGRLRGWPPEGRALGSQNSLLIGRSFLEGCTDVYFQDLKMMGNWKWGNTLTFGAEFGRLGYQVTPYIFKRNNYNALYYDNPRWASGDHTFDGALLRFGVSNVRLDLFGGRTSRRFASGAGDDCGCPCDEINPIVIYRPLPFCCGSFYNNQNVLPSELGHHSHVDQFAGARLNVPIGKWGDINLAYLALSTDHPFEVCAPYVLCQPQERRFPVCEPPCGWNCSRVNRLDVAGGDITINPTARIQLQGGYSKSNYYCGSDLNWDDDNNAGYVQASYKADRYGLLAGYKRVEKNYNAPGAWERLGLEYNPRDIQGGYGNAYVDVLKNVRLSFSGQWYSGISEAVSCNNYYSLIGQIDYKVTPRWLLTAKYEQVEFCYPYLRDSWCDNPRQRWGTVKTSYALTNQATLNVGYQFGGTNWLTPYHFNGFRCLSPGRPCCDPWTCRPTQNDFWGRGDCCNVSGNVFKGGLIFAHLIYKF